jgi:DNA-directed RNA polymerase specialized sigma24 family protein
MQPQTAPKVQYVNGKDFFDELVIYHEKYKYSKANDLDIPPITDKIASAIVRIANKLSNSWNFVNYTYKDEMVQDGILKCLEKIHNFDPEKSTNGFAYATQLIFNEFLNRIKKEQHQSSVKAKMIREKMSMEFVEHGVDSDTESSGNAFVEFLKDVDCFTDYHEVRLEKVKKEIHPSLVHRNKSYAPKKVVEAKDIPLDLSEFA